MTLGHLDQSTAGTALALDTHLSNGRNLGIATMHSNYHT